MLLRRILLAPAFALLLSSQALLAQTSFGSGCAGASGVTPQLTASSVVQSGQPWTVEVAAPGGIGLGYLLVGFSNRNASALGGAALPLDLGALFSDPLWSGCELAVDPSYLFLPYTFDPSVNGGVWSMDLQGFDTGQVYLQALNIDFDFTARIAGVSRGLLVTGSNTFVPGMVPIPPGTFEMGSDAPAGEPYFGEADEVVHTVTISAPFWMAEHEVTQAEYEALTGSNPSTTIGPDRPVEGVSWFDAALYCQNLTVQAALAGQLPQGYEYRLPTEAEWEYACRAGRSTEFGVGNGDELLCADAWFSYSYHSQSGCNFGFDSVDVGFFTPNDWGLFDMHGNVWEWCLDTYAAYPAGPVIDPFASGGTNRVLRGGGYADLSFFCRAANRSSSPPASTFASVGFRVVLAPALTP